MSQRVVTPWLNTNIPKAYVNESVISQPVGLGASGILVIMGEADGGPSYQNTVLKNNAFTPDQLSQVQAKYLSGQIVDAFQALTSPSNDANITGTANLIYIVKTNSGSKATSNLLTSAVSPTTYGALADLNWGLPGNNYSYQVTELNAEVAPTITGNTIPSLAALNPGMAPAFSIRLNGGALTAVTLPAGTYTTGAQVAAALTGLPAGITASGTAVAPYSITLTVTADAFANGNGWAKSFELVEGAAPGDLAALGLTAGIYTSAQEAQVEVSIDNTTTGLTESFDVEPAIALTVGYAGTTGTMTITAAGLLTTTVTGGSGGNLSITLSAFTTIGALATFINSQPGYTANAAAAASQLPTSALDTVTAIGIAATASGLMPGRVKDAAYLFNQLLNTSKGAAFAPTATAGLPGVMAQAAYLAGGARGNTLAADIVNALEQISGVACNIIVPLFSQDATEDIAEGQTGSGSTYTIAAINALTKNHCIEFSAPELGRNRICILSYTDNTENTYVNAKEQAQSLANYRCSLCMQSIMQANSVGVIETFQPWYAAVIAAGMQAGGFYQSITNKLANLISFVDPNGFDSGSPGDVSDALNAGMLFLNALASGSAWVSDQTTYGYDANFVYNSLQAVYDADLIALDMAASFTAAFVGKSVADVSSSTALAYLGQKMNGYLRIKLIATSDDAPLGYKNAKVVITPPTMYVNVEIKLDTAIYFIPIQINISQVQQSAG